MGIPASSELLALAEAAQALAAAGVNHMRVGDLELWITQGAPKVRSAATADAPSHSPPSVDDRIAKPDDYEALLYASSGAAPIASGNNQ